MSERPPQQPEQPEPNPDQPDGPWDPAEQIDDVGIGPGGQIESATKREPDAEPAGPDGEPDPSETHETEPEEHPRIWVGSLLDYNNAILHGRWIDAARDEDKIWADIRAMLADSPTTRQTGEPAEEHGIFDFDGFHGLRIGEQESISYVSRVAKGIAEHGPAFAAWADVMQDEDLLDAFEENFLGKWDSTQAYADNLADDLGYYHLLDQKLPESLRRYVSFDIDQFADDLVLGGDIHVIDAQGGGVWIFRA
jgi:antirestriction protein